MCGCVGRRWRLVVRRSLAGLRDVVLPFFRCASSVGLLASDGVFHSLRLRMRCYVSAAAVDLVITETFRSPRAPCARPCDVQEGRHKHHAKSASCSDHTPGFVLGMSSSLPNLMRLRWVICLVSDPSGAC